MHDLRFIREQAADFDKAMARRGFSSISVEILKLDEERRAVQTELQTVQQERNAKSKEIGQIKAQGGDAQEVMDAVSVLKEKMTALEERERVLGEKLHDILAGLPNIMSHEVPDGADEEDNVEIHRWGESRVSKEEAKEHYEIGEALGYMDFETAAKLSGSRFVMLTGPLARLERALAQFMLDTQTEENGYTEVSPPLMVRDQTMYGTGQLPKFEDDLYKAQDLDKDFARKVAKEYIEFLNSDDDSKKQSVFDRLISYTKYAEEFELVYQNALNRSSVNKWLIPTSEVPLTNIVAGDIVDTETLPRRYTAFTPCFRSEAGSAGKDTRGMLRQHQFYKVEMVCVTEADKSEAEHERMLQCAQGVLEKLNLPYRTVVLCSGDTGFGARKTYDIEVWLPGQDTFREISSCSNCWDFQARRMNARTRAKGEKQTQFVHTLNGSGLAVGRTLIAVMENYYDPTDGGVFVPDVLKPYMGGIEKITKL